MCKPWVLVAVYLVGFVMTWGYMANTCANGTQGTAGCHKGTDDYYLDFLVSQVWPAYIPMRISKNLWRVHWFEGPAYD